MGLKLRILIWVGKWVASFMDCICGLLGFITFTIYRPWWDFKIRGWFGKKIIKLRNKDVVEDNGRETPLDREGVLNAMIDELSECEEESKDIYAEIDGHEYQQIKQRETKNV